MFLVSFLHMGQLLQNLLDGARQVLVLRPDIDYIRPSKNDFRDDIKSLREDANRVVRDFHITTSKHGEQIYHR